MSQEPIPELFRQRIQEAKERQLEELDLSNESGADYSQKLTRIPDKVFELTHLQVLDLSGNKIRNIPDTIAKLSNLSKLNLSKNKLSSLPEFINNLSNLKELILFRNILCRLPEHIDKLDNLSKLDLNYNQLSTLPDSLGNLSKLTWLSLSSNQLSKLPSSFGKLSNLKELYISSNQLSEFPESINNFCNLNILNLSYNSLSALPNFISNLENLTTLDLRRNKLTNLPNSLGNLLNLKELYLNRNELSILPDSLGNLKSLVILYLGRNNLFDLPISFGNISQLNELYLNHNQLSCLPDSFANLSYLTTLDLTANQLTILPDSLNRLSNLTGLNLSENKLDILPNFLTNLSNLRLLYLNHNQLSTLPPSFLNLSHLITLDLSENPLEKPPIEVAKKGIKAIREYFRQLREEGTDYIYEAKLLIVGEAGAGKTTLANKILNPDYQLRYDQETTKGIDVIKWRFPLNNEQEFKVNIWDFGGHEIYHATHQFFLTKRSLYTLVADTRREDTDFYYWLNIVELLSNNSPLLIVKNEKQDRKREINERALRGQFTNLKETLATNLKTNRDLEEILTNIKHYISNLEHIGSALPKTWVQVRRSLEEDERNYISLQEYLDICETNGFTRLEDKLQLSGYLHDLGVCLHFQEQADSLLYRTVILKPEWGTNAVYKILDNPKVINNQGCFTRDDLKNIWHEDKYASMRGELLELMKKFQLCYEIPSKKDTFIAPQLLSENQPEYDWDDSHNLILSYTYEFMPNGIMTQLIVAMHQHIYQQKYVWRSGVILNKDNTLAEVIEDYPKREITIRVTGKFKRNLMTEVTYELDKINNSYHRLKFQKLVPCNCSACINTQDPHSYKFNKLLERIAHNQLTIQCDNPPYHQVQVLGLIDHALDIRQLIPQDKQNRNKSIRFEGDIQQLVFQLLEQGNISGDFMSGDRHINQTHSGGGDNVAGDKNINQSRKLNISGNAQVNASGAGAFNQGDNQGTIANTINQNNSQQLKESKLVKIFGIAAALATIIALFFNGIFNTEVRQWFDNLFERDIPSTSEPEQN